MADKVKPKKGAGQNLIMLGIIILILIFVAVECASVLSVSLKTQTAEVATVYDTVETRALIIRDEKTVQSKSGVAVATVSDGEKVKKGGNIAMLFSSAENAQNYSNYLELEKERQHYIDLINVSVGSVTDIETLEGNILSSVNGFIRSAARGEVSAAEDCGSTLSDYLTKREMLINENIDFTEVLKEINGKISGIDVNSCKPSDYIKADESGYYSKYTDGCEGQFGYSEVKDLDVNTFNGYLEKALSVKGSVKGGGKIIGSFVWYLCCVVNSQDLEGLENGDSVEVYIKSLDKTIKCKIEKGAGTSAASENTLLVLSCNEMSSELSALRLEDIEIRVKSYTGVKVSPSAVHELDGKKGVYALVSNIAKWRRADILYTGEDYVILSYGDSEISGGIKPYDEIIIRGKDVHNGKVFA